MLVSKFLNLTRAAPVAKSSLEPVVASLAQHQPQRSASTEGTFDYHPFKLHLLDEGPATSTTISRDGVHMLNDSIKDSESLADSESSTDASIEEVSPVSEPAIFTLSSQGSLELDSSPSSLPEFPLVMALNARSLVLKRKSLSTLLSEYGPEILLIF